MSSKMSFKNTQTQVDEYNFQAFTIFSTTPDAARLHGQGNDVAGNIILNTTVEKEYVKSPQLGFEIKEKCLDGNSRTQPPTPQSLPEQIT